MKGIATLFIAFVLSVCIVNSQNLNWAYQIGGPSTDQGNGTCLDREGNLITVGFFNGTADFVSGSGNHYLTANGTNAFIHKMKPFGQMLWTLHLGAPGSAQAIAVRTDSKANIIVAGYFQGSSDLDPGPGTQTFNSHGSTDVFILKLDSAGNTIWVKRIGGTGFDIPTSLTIDGDDKVYVVGRFENSIDFDPGPGTDGKVSHGSSDGFIMVLDSIGNYLWSAIHGGNDIDLTTDVTIDASGSVLTTGSFRGTADFSVTGSPNNFSAHGSQDGFVQKYSKAGNYVWTATIGGTSLTTGQGIAVDAARNIYASGDFYGNTDFDPGPATSNISSLGLADAYILKLDSNGMYRWAGSLGDGGMDSGLEIEVDSSSHVYVAGYYTGTADLDVTPGTNLVTSPGSNDMFLMELDTALQFNWGLTTSCLFGVQPRDLFVTDQNLIATGYFNHTVDFNPPSSADTLQSFGDYDVFIINVQGFPTSVTQAKNSKKLKIYPSIGRGIIDIKLNTMAHSITVSIHNISGKHVMTRRLRNTSSINLSIPGPPGMYVIGLEIDGNYTTHKIVKL